MSGAIGEKIATFIFTISTVVCGFAIAFARGWELALICTAAIPFLAVGAGLFTVTI